MKKLGIIFTITGLMISIHAVYITHAKETEPLLQIVSVMNEVGASIDTWSLKAKDKQGFTTDWQGYKSIVNELHSVAADFAWEEPSYEENSIVQKATKQSLRESIEEKLTILTHHSGETYETIISYEMIGKDWNENRQDDIFTHFSTRTSELFFENPNFYSCVTGKFSDTMEIALSNQAKEMMSQLNANFVESIEEESFVSLSAYNRHWDTSLQTNNKKMNLQIALRDEGKNEPTRVLIGTPILTAEY